MAKGGERGKAGKARREGRDWGEKVRERKRGRVQGGEGKGG